MEQAAEASQDRINDALGRGAWPEVFDLLLARESAGTLNPVDRPLLAVAAYVAGAPDVAVRTWEHAYADATAAGDHEAAAEAGIHIAFLLLDAGLMAELRGWLARVERLLPGLPQSIVHAGFEVVQAFRSLWAGDHETSLEHARRAVELGTRFGDRSTVAFARSAEGRALILLGHVGEGLVLLDEVALAAASGELDPITTGAVYCAAVCAFQAVADYDGRATSTARSGRSSRPTPWGGTRSRSSRCSIWLGATCRARRPRSATRSTIRPTRPRRRTPRTRSSAALPCSPRRPRSRSLPATSTGPGGRPTGSARSPGTPAPPR